MRSKNKFSIHDLVVFGVVLSLCFVLSGCSSKKDKSKIEEQAETIKTLQEEVVKLGVENDEMQRSLAEALDKIKNQADLMLHDKAKHQADLTLHNEEKQLMDPNNLLKKILTGIVSKSEKQSASDLYNVQIQRLKQENEELRKLLAETTSKFKDQEISASLRSITEQTVDQYDGQVEAVIAEFDLDISPRRKIELIDSLIELAQDQAPPVIDIVQMALDDPDPKVGRAAIRLLEDYETTEVIPAIRQALESRDEQTRIGALAPLANVNDPQVADLLIDALNDRSEEVRSIALDMAQEQVDDIQLSVFEEGLGSLYEDVKLEALSLLEDRSDHVSVDIILTGLLDEDPKFREEVNWVLDFLIDQEFETYDAAFDWWDANKHKYDEDLFEIGEDDN